MTPPPPEEGLSGKRGAEGTATPAQGVVIVAEPATIS